MQCYPLDELPIRRSSLYAAMANRVVIDVFSAKPSATYCMVTPCKCRIAIVMYAIWIPLLTAAVAKQRQRLCMVALCQPKTGAKTLSILVMKVPVMGTTLPRLIRTNNGLFTDNLSLRFKRSLTIFNHFQKACTCIQDLQIPHAQPCDVGA